MKILIQLAITVGIILFVIGVIQLDAVAPVVVDIAFGVLIFLAVFMFVRSFWNNP